MSIYIIYNTVTDDFVKNIEVTNDTLRDINIGVNEGYIIGSLDPSVEYISAGVVTARPVNTATISATSVGLGGVVNVTNIPNPSDVVVKSSFNIIGSGTVTDGNMNFSSLDVGVYTISISSFPYQD